MIILFFIESTKKDSLIVKDGDCKRLPPPEWLDEEFILRAIKEGVDNSKIKVSNLLVDYATDPGDNYASEIYRVTAQINGGKGNLRKISLIVKCLSRGGEVSQLIHDNNIFHREAVMFQENVFQMNEILKGIDDFESFSAHCYMSTDDPTQILVLEDLTKSGFILAKRHQGLDLPHCLLVMKTIAKFHAASVILHDKNPSPMKLFYTNSMFSEESKKIMNNFLISGIKAVSDKLKEWPEFSCEISGKLEILSQDLFEKLSELVKPKPDHFNVLIHGDLWVNNMMFKYSEGEVDNMKLLDLQMSSISSPALDLLYFLETSANETVYLSHMNDLILEYHSTLTETLCHLEYNGKPYTFENLKSDLEEHALFSLFSAFCVLPIILSRSEDNYDIDEAITNSEHATTKIYSNPLYESAVRKRVPIFLRKELF